MHKNEWFQVWFFQLSAGRGSPSFLPRPLPVFSRALPSVRASPSILRRFAPLTRASLSILGCYASLIHRRFAPSIRSFSPSSLNQSGPQFSNEELGPQKSRIRLQFMPLTPFISPLSWMGLDKTLCHFNRIMEVHNPLGLSPNPTSWPPYLAAKIGLPLFTFEMLAGMPHHQRHQAFLNRTSNQLITVKLAEQCLGQISKGVPYVWKIFCSKIFVKITGLSIGAVITYTMKPQTQSYGMVTLINNMSLKPPDILKVQMNCGNTSQFYQYTYKDSITGDIKHNQDADLIEKVNYCSHFNHIIVIISSKKYIVENNILLKSFWIFYTLVGQCQKYSIYSEWNSRSPNYFVNSG